MKKCWCQQNSWIVSRDLNNFWIFFRQGTIVPSFIIVRFMWQTLGRGVLLLSPYVSSLKKPISNRVNIRLGICIKFQCAWYLGQRDLQPWGCIYSILIWTLQQWHYCFKCIEYYRFIVKEHPKIIGNICQLKAFEWQKLIFISP